MGFSDCAAALAEKRAKPLTTTIDAAVHVWSNDAIKYPWAIDPDGEPRAPPPQLPDFVATYEELANNMDEQVPSALFSYFRAVWRHCDKDSNVTPPLSSLSSYIRHFLSRL